MPSDLTKSCQAAEADRYHGSQLELPEPPEFRCLSLQQKTALLLPHHSLLVCHPLLHRLGDFLQDQLHLRRALNPDKQTAMIFDICYCILGKSGERQEVYLRCLKSTIWTAPFWPDK